MSQKPLTAFDTDEENANETNNDNNTTNMLSDVLVADTEDEAEQIANEIPYVNDEDKERQFKIEERVRDIMYMYACLELVNSRDKLMQPGTAYIDENGKIVL